MQLKNAFFSLPVYLTLNVLNLRASLHRHRAARGGFVNGTLRGAAAREGERLAGWGPLGPCVLKATTGPVKNSAAHTSGRART